MNWTGGGLSRHSRKTGVLTARQKQHFAKVQISQRTGAKKRSPRRRSILGHIVDEPLMRSPSADLVKGHSPSQVSHERSTSRWPPKFIPRPSTRRGSIRASSHESQQTHNHEKHPTEIKIEQFERACDDLYDATPEPPNKKRKQDTVVIQSEQKISSISETRRRLLRKADWVGITVQEPLHYSFVPPTYGDRFGKRRKVSHQAQYNSRHTGITSSLLTRARRESSHFSGIQEQRDTPGRTDVRISIGGRTLNPGVSSSTAPSRIHSSLTHTHVLECQTASSDVMLLDQENNHDLLHHNFSKEQVLPERSQKGIQQYSRRRGERSEWPGRPGPSYNTHHIECQEDEQPDCLSAEDFSNINGQHTSYSNDSRVNQNEGAIFSSSSSVSVQHPVPLSSKLKLFLHNLRSSSSELANSTIAHVGEINPVVPQSQVLDNEVWETWVDKLAGEDDLEEIHDQPVKMDVFISPGVSEAPAQNIQGYDRGSSSSSAKPSTTVLKSIVEQERPSSNISILSFCSSLVTSQPVQTKIENFDKDQALRYSHELASNRLIVSPPGVICGLEAHVKPTLGEKPAWPNPDEIWRKFVFSDSDEEDEPVEYELPQALTSAYVTIKTLPSSSVLGNASINSSLTGKRKRQDYNQIDLLENLSRSP